MSERRLGQFLTNKTYIAPLQVSLNRMEEAGDGSGLSALTLDGFSKELQAIASFARRRNDWIKASDVRGRVRLFRSTQYSPDDIRAYFCQLAEQGLGTVDGEGEMLKYRF